MRISRPEGSRGQSDSGRVNLLAMEDDCVESMNELLEIFGALWLIPTMAGEITTGFAMIEDGSGCPEGDRFYTMQIRNLADITDTCEDLLKS